MVVTLFIMGLPGSGKSTASRHIIDFAERNSWGITRFRDYKILFIKYLADREPKRFRSTEYGGFDIFDSAVFDEALEEFNRRFVRFLAEVEGKRFRSTEYGGFDILDYTVLDETLEELNIWVEQQKKPVDSNKELYVIEFSRNDYCKALSFFSSHLLEDAYFLFIDTPIPICRQRIRDRVTKPPEERNEDDNDVSEYIFETYYNKDQRRYRELVAPQMRKQFGIREKNIHVINNGADVSEEKFHRRITAFAVNTLRLNT